MTFRVIVREPVRGFHYSVLVAGKDSREAIAKVQADLDEWQENDVIVQAIPVAGPGPAAPVSMRRLIA